MGDLISRSDLLKKFDDAGIQITFDLPVEEILGDDVDIDDFAMLVQDAIQAYKKMVIGTIKEQPTAYNVEKVEKELIKEMNIANYDQHNVKGGAIAHGKYMAYTNSIDIVKRGGVDGKE